MHRYITLTRYREGTLYALKTEDLHVLYEEKSTHHPGESYTIIEILPDRRSVLVRETVPEILALVEPRFRPGVIVHRPVELKTGD